MAPACCMLTLGRILKRASTRGFCSRSPMEEIRSQMEKLAVSLSPSVVQVASFFYGSDDRKIPYSCRGGNGVFLDPKLIVTSAHAVGRVSTVYESITLEKPDRFEHGSVIYKSCIGSSAALTDFGKILKTTPLAVNYVSDVAVLEVVGSESEGDVCFPHCALANYVPDKENVLLNIAQEQDSQFTIMLGNVRAVGEKTIKAKAPWPMDNELGWIEYEWLMFGGVQPPPGRNLLNSRDKVTGSITRFSGSPWFNLRGEVIGISSWEVRDELAMFLAGFVVPLQCIRSVLEYAKTKRPEDPIVMDRWINAYVIHGD